MNTLILLSGGLDSTTCLVRMLKETDDDIMVHYIYYINKEGRYDAEKEAVNKIVPYCKKIRDFKYTESVQDYSQIGVPYDLHVTRFTAAQICRYNEIDRVITVRCANDYQDLTSSEKIFYTCLAECPRKIEWYFPNQHLTKKDEMEYLKKETPELLEFIHSCRRPIKENDKWKECKKCSTCLETLNTLLDFHLL